MKPCKSDMFLVSRSDVIFVVIKSEYKLLGQSLVRHKLVKFTGCPTIFAISVKAHLLYLLNTSFGTLKIEWCCLM